MNKDNKQVKRLNDDIMRTLTKDSLISVEYTEQNELHISQIKVAFCQIS